MAINGSQEAARRAGNTQNHPESAKRAPHTHAQREPNEPKRGESVKSGHHTPAQTATIKRNDHEMCDGVGGAGRLMVLK